jgi:hypothetical protein
MEDLDLDTKRKIWAYATTLSIAEFDLIESFITHSHKSPNTTAIDQLDNIMDRLKNTTSLGDQAEDDFIMWLQTHNVRPKDIIRFNTYGNLVDVTFQTDLLLNHNGQWIPIQVKNKETKISKLLNYNIGGIIIYPAPTKFNCGSWIFFNGESLAKSFDEVYFNLSC